MNPSHAHLITKEEEDSQVDDGDNVPYHVILICSGVIMIFFTNQDLPKYTSESQFSTH